MIGLLVRLEGNCIFQQDLLKYVFVLVSSANRLSFSERRTSIARMSPWFQGSFKVLPMIDLQPRHLIGKGRIADCVRLREGPWASGKYRFPQRLGIAVRMPESFHSADEFLSEAFRLFLCSRGPPPEGAEKSIGIFFSLKGRPLSSGGSIWESYLKL